MPPCTHVTPLEISQQHASNDALEGGVWRWEGTVPPPKELEGHQLASTYVINTYHFSF
jgi:hypothetical protein